MAVRPKGPLPRSWKPRSEKGRAVLADVLDRYAQHAREDTLSRGGRGIFYDLRPRGFGRGIAYRKGKKGRGPGRANADYAQDIVASARRAGLIPESWVADRSGATSRVPWLGPQTAAEAAGQVMDSVIDADVELDRQGGQPVYLEVWCEAGDLVDRLARVAGEHHVPVYSGGGMDSLKAKRRAAARVADRFDADGTPTTVLLVGDLDLLGHRIRNVYEADVTAWLVNGHGVPAEAVEFVTIAVTPEQAEEYDLLDDDGKAEADGVPVPVMDALLTDAITSRQVPAVRESVAEAEREANATLRTLVAQGVDVLAES